MMKLLVVAALAVAAQAQLDPAVICNQFCQDIFNPICGSDGVTYDNDCFFAEAACVAAIRGQSDPSVPSLTVASLGACAGTGGGGNPIPDPEPDCGRCSLQYSPVCATNGVTYGNACLLRQAACLSQGIETITLDYPTECDTEGEPDVCNDACPDIWEPVCVNDAGASTTYPSACVVAQVNCAREQFGSDPMMVEYDGECVEIGPGDTGDDLVQKCVNVCEESAIAGESACEFQKQSCLNFGSPIMCQTSFDQCIGVVETAKAQCLTPCAALRDIDLPDFPDFPEFPDFP